METILAYVFIKILCVGLFFCIYIGYWQTLVETLRDFGLIDMPDDAKVKKTPVRKAINKINKKRRKDD